MSISVFPDKLVPPDEPAIQAALGTKWPLWDQLCNYLNANYPFERQLTYGGKNYGWNFWYRRSGKTLVSLYPQSGGFTVQLVLGRIQVEKAMGLDLHETARKKLEETPQLHDGKWLFIPIETLQDVEDVIRLIAAKQKPRHQTAG